MQQRNMGVPRCANVDAETKGMIFRKAEVIRGSFIQKSEPAGRSRVPGIRRNHIQSGLQLRRESRLIFGLLAFINVDSHLPPRGFCASTEPHSGPLSALQNLTASPENCQPSVEFGGRLEAARGQT